MKVLFLDVDGVLNHEDFLRENFGGGDIHKVDPNCLDRIARIVQSTGCRVVLSSTWRLSVVSLIRIRDQLQTVGVSIYSTTPDSIKSRREEIQLWLDVNKNVIEFAILDDDKDADIGKNFFKTSFKSGLTDEITNQIIEHFGPRSSTG